MDAFRSDSMYSIPSCFKDQSHDLKNIEAEANQALNHIKSLYEEIMHPCSFDEYLNESCKESSDSSHSSIKVNKQCDINPNNFRKRSNSSYNNSQIFDHYSLHRQKSSDHVSNYRNGRSNNLYNDRFDNGGSNYCDNCRSKICDSNRSNYCSNDRSNKYNNSRSSSFDIQMLNNKTQCQFSVSTTNIQQTKISKSDVQITVPQPFLLSGFDKKRIEAKQQKLAKLKNELDIEKEKEFNVKVKSKPVPKNTHLPLYKEMVKNNEKRKMERRVKSLEVFGRASKHDESHKQAILDIKPTYVSSCNSNNNFKDELIIKKVPSTKISEGDMKHTSESNCNFKAKPLPMKSLSSKVSEELKKKEEIRKMLNAHRAEKLLQQSVSPLTKKNISRSYSMLDLKDYKKETVDKSTKPNISEITERLYTKKCKETIEMWNCKVMRYGQKENVELKNLPTEPKLQPEHKFPFLYYPVRMSTASSLRDKQIRAEILARKKREQPKQVNKEIEAQQEMHEEIARKLQQLIPAIDSEKEINEKVKHFKESQRNRKLEYERELEEILKRVSEQQLLIERQSKNKDVNVKKKLSSEDKSTDLQIEDSKSDKDETLSEPEQSEEMESYTEQEESED